MRREILDELKFKLSNSLFNSSNSSYNIEDSLHNVSISTQDTNGETIKIYMTEFENIIINGDKLKNKYVSKYHFPAKPSSVDAIYKFKNDNIYLIEFKNGSIEKIEIYKKAYDTFIILLDLEIIENINFSRNKVFYILVYKEDTSNINQANIENEIEAKAGIYKNKDLFRIGSFEEYLFKEAFACSKENFDKYIVNEFINEEK